jgi:hypothetical protein
MTRAVRWWHIRREIRNNPGRWALLMLALLTAGLCLIQATSAMTSETAASIMCQRVNPHSQITIVPAMGDGNITAFCESRGTVLTRIDVYQNPIRHQMRRIMVYPLNAPAAQFHPKLHGNEGAFDTDIIWPHDVYPQQPPEQCDSMQKPFQNFDLCHDDFMAAK